jgi:serine/threonine protein kinase
MLTQALQEYAQLQEAGERVDRQEFVRRFPEIGAELDECLQQIDWIGELAGELSGDSTADSANVPGELSPAAHASHRILGDYRILRQIGRGGMGVVYEAEQISLARRVALKALPSAAMLDAIALQRFQNEARAAASLDHPHIVDVIGVGCERGVHFYAMRFIDGESLADVIRHLREEQEASLHGRSTRPQPGSCEVDSSGRADVDASGAAAGQYSSSGTSETIRPHATAPGSTPLNSRSHAAFYRAAAELGVQAADALDHAHELGIVHRDVKPSNLLIDSRGKLWVTDFGLAHIETAASLTMTGDLVGTVRYMSPEQAAGSRGLCDHRSDIYSLGMTLYELLTLSPAFPDTDRIVLLEQIQHALPPAPGQLNRAIPHDLETIVLKAIEKSPLDRYETAAEMAEDLVRFLAGKPILARRPGPTKRLVMWSRRHQGFVRLAGVFLIFIGIGAAIAVRMLWNERNATSSALATVIVKTHQLAQSNHELRASKARLQVLHDMSYQALQSSLEASLDCSAPADRLVAIGDFENAALLYRSAITVFKRIEPQLLDEELRSSYRATLAIHYERLAELSQQIGKLVEAESTWKGALENYRKLVDHSDAGSPQKDVFLVEAARAKCRLADVLYESGKPAEAETLYDEAARELEETGPSELFADREQLLRVHLHYGRGNACWDADRRAEAQESFRQCFECIEQLEEAMFDIPLTCSELAWMLITSPVSGPTEMARGLQLAQRAVAKLPSEVSEPTDSPGYCYAVLGMAHYRNEDWQSAADALTKSVELKTRINHADGLFLAMALWQLGKQDESRNRYSESLAWMEQLKPLNPQLRRFRTEAADFLSDSAAANGN